MAWAEVSPRHEYYKQYYARNKEKMLKATMKYRLDNPGVASKYRPDASSVFNKDYDVPDIRVSYYDRNRSKILEDRKVQLKKKRYDAMPQEVRDRILNNSLACAICGAESNPHDKSLSLDHNHATGQWRDWLCDRCNTALGLIREREDVCFLMAAYIRKWNGVQGKAAELA